MKTIKIRSFGVTAVFCAILAGCGEPQSDVEEPEQLRPVRTLLLSSQVDGPMVEFPAVVDAASSADLSFKVPGEVTELLVKQGEEVEVGDVIAKLDATDYQLSLDEAQANYNKAQADFNRAKQLIKSGTISQSDYDQLQSHFTSAKSKLANAQNNLSYTSLKASFSGVVARTYIERFEEVQAKQVIATLQDIKHITLKVNVPESLMIKVSKDAPKHIIAEFSGIPDKTFPLDFVEVSTQADEVTKAYEVTLSMTRPENYNILPGMTAKVLAKGADVNKSGLYLPINTVLKDSTGNYVWTVDSVGNGKGEISKKSVVIGEVSTLGFPVISGVNEGDYIVTAGMSKVSEGQLVKFNKGAQ
ncbi:efflux RND transporter periplasmic adaptor subunit [Pseudoalteromonas luteoviolacea]|uniref:efflux RND transporter periplasmic adaptor subunit n=1 Tax=Pseudoalteromonas luteoviolacea TaxID=43657 RepID=UPI001B38D3B4|nr:efflux RND transporter periplasmic adaptor subunit [Pseudoalteromonas luteoviolacea]MBQ4814487.1 efflux RND transporter periplasmic adaptor subunit [Pseudoalteromonas luteoviolacea]